MRNMGPALRGDNYNILQAGRIWVSKETTKLYKKEAGIVTYVRVTTS